MLPLVEIPNTIRRGLAPYRSLFCRDAGFEHISRYLVLYHYSRQADRSAYRCSRTGHDVG